MTYDILFPVLNEELRLQAGIEETVRFLDASFSNADIRLTIVDNGSTDGTEAISKALCEKYGRLGYVRIQEKGVGAAFRAGVAETRCDIVGYMDIDLSTDLGHLGQVVDIFSKEPQVDMVNGSRYSKNSVLLGRKWHRNAISHVLVAVLKLFFHMKASDAICGFKFFKADRARELIQASTSEPGWFFMIELLLRAERKGMTVRELPVKWVFEEHTKVRVWKVTKNYMAQMWRLYWSFRRGKG